MFFFHTHARARTEQQVAKLLSHFKKGQVIMIHRLHDVPRKPRISDLSMVCRKLSWHLSLQTTHPPGLMILDLAKVSHTAFLHRPPLLLVVNIELQISTVYSGLVDGDVHA